MQRIYRPVKIGDVIIRHHICMLSSYYLWMSSCYRVELDRRYDRVRRKRNPIWKTIVYCRWFFFSLFFSCASLSSSCWRASTARLTTKATSFVVAISRHFNSTGFVSAEHTLVLSLVWDVTYTPHAQFGQFNNSACEQFFYLLYGSHLILSCFLHFILSFHFSAIVFLFLSFCSDFIAALSNGIRRTKGKRK